MEILRYFFQSSKRMVALIALTALISGACNTGLLALINKALHREYPVHLLAWLFAGIALLKLLTSLASDLLLVRFAFEMMERLRAGLVRRILAVPLRKLEELGSSRILANLTDDVDRINNALQIVPYLSTNAAMLVGGALYLGWLSWKALLVMLVFVLIGIASYRLLMSQSKKLLNRARENYDELLNHFRALTDGIKELKLHRDRRRAFLSEDLKQTEEVYRRNNLGAETRFCLAQTWSPLPPYPLLSLILF